jgi:hypothetical protein
LSNTPKLSFKLKLKYPEINIYFDSIIITLELKYLVFTQKLRELGTVPKYFLNFHDYVKSRFTRMNNETV